MHICICIHILNVSILIHTSICTALSDIFYLAEASFVPKTLNRVHNKLQCIFNVNGIFREKKTLKKTTLIYPQIFKFLSIYKTYGFQKVLNLWIVGFIVYKKSITTIINHFIMLVWDIMFNNTTKQWSLPLFTTLEQ